MSMVAWEASSFMDSGAALNGGTPVADRELK